MIIIFTMFFISITSISAADYSVTGTTFEDIEDTIDGSNDNDRILLGNKTYTSTGSQIRVTNKSNIVVQGKSDSERAILNAGHNGRIFVVDENSTVIFKYIDFINGDSGATSGAAIFTYNTIIVENCSFRNNWGESGGAIFIRPGADNSRIVNSSFINNEGRYEGEDEFVEGGAVDTHANFTSIIDCVFTGNSALSVGGAINFASNTIGQKLIGSTFRNNHAPMGGALRSINNDLLIENCTFIDNYANETSGGALYLRLTEITIKNCVFTNNHALNNGGAIYDIDISSFGYLKIFHCNFTNNRAANGGAVYSQNPLNVTDSNFLNNSANSDNAGGIYSANTILIQNSNFTANTGRALVLGGDGTIISGNNFTSNSEHAIRSTNLKNATFKDNVFKNNKGMGIFVTGNNVNITNNNFENNTLAINITGFKNYIYKNNISNSKNEGIIALGNNVEIHSNLIFKNGKSGVILTGNNAKINRNNIFNNKKYGLYLIGKNSKISNNNIQNNLQGINIKGNNHNLNNNYVYKNKEYGILLKSNSTKLTSNTINNNKIGVKITGKKNSLEKNILESNTKEGCSLTGNENTVKNSKFSKNKGNTLTFSGSKCIIKSNNISNSNCAIFVKGNNNKAYNNVIKSNKVGLSIQGNKNSISTNIIRNNNIGIKHNSGKNNNIAYNAIVNKKVNLQKSKGTLNANYNWWGKNGIDKVKNIKISKYAIAKLSIPEASYLKANHTYSINILLKDNKNKNLRSNIPSIVATSSLKTKLNNKTSKSIISTKKMNFSKNKLEITFKIPNQNMVYSFVSKMDKQTLKHIFQPPANLDLKVISYSAPAISGFVDTYQIRIKNLGNRDAYNITLKSSFPKFTRAVYSFNGLKWEKFSKSISINKLKKYSVKKIYIRGQLKKNFTGDFNTTFKVKTSTLESDYENNKEILKVKVGGKKHYSHCGSLVLEMLLLNHGKKVSVNNLMNELKNDYRGVSFYNMINVSKKYNITLRGVSLNSSQVKPNDIALIKIKKENHYVLITHNSKKYVRFVDPLLGPLILTKADFNIVYSGKSLTTGNTGKEISLKTLKTLKGRNIYGIGGSIFDWSVNGALTGSRAGPGGALIGGVLGAGGAFIYNYMGSLKYSGGSTPMKGYYNSYSPFKGVTNLHYYSNSGGSVYYYKNSAGYYIPVIIDLKVIESGDLDYYTKEARKIAKGNKGNLNNVARWLPYLTGAGLLSSNSAKIMSKVSLILIMGENVQIHERTLKDPTKGKVQIIPHGAEKPGKVQQNNPSPWSGDPDPESKKWRRYLVWLAGGSALSTFVGYAFYVAVYKKRP